MRKRKPDVLMIPRSGNISLWSVAVILSIVGTLSGPPPATAQSAAPQRVGLRILEKPMKYQSPKTDDDYSPDPARVPQRQWIVHSDRDVNIAYSDLKKTAVHRILQFMEQFYVVEEQGEYVHVVKDPAPSGLRLSNRYEECGWIHKQYLLLWDYCMLDSETNTPKKVMVLNTLRHLYQNGKGSGELVEFRQSPDINSPVATTRSQVFQFFFLLKSENDWALLSTVQYIGGRDSSVKIDTLVAGWIPWTRLVGWYTRVAVEPNWDSAACAERLVGKRAKVFVSEQAALQYKNGEKLPDEVVWWDADSLERRPPGEWRRFPVLRASTSSPGVIEVMANGSTSATRDIAIEAYLTYKIRDQKHAIFRKVILLSKNELYDHWNKMQEIIDSRAERKALVETWLKLAKGANTMMKESDLLDQNLSALNDRIFGMTGGDSFSAHTRLADLFNTTLVREADLVHYLDALAQKAIMLKKIADAEEGGYRHMFRSNGVAYYWIGEDSLP